MTAEVDFEVTAHHVRLALRGDQDLEAVPVLTAELTAAEQMGRPIVVVDLDEVTLLSAAAIGPLLRSEREIAARQGRLVLVCRQPRTLNILHLTRVDRRLDICPTLTEALQPPRIRDRSTPPGRLPSPDPIVQRLAS